MTEAWSEAAKNKLMLLLTLLAVTACASSSSMRQFTAKEAAVRVTTNPAATTGCQFLGLVYTDKMATEAYRELQFHVEAAKIGANLVWYDDSERKHGEAYRCLTALPVTVSPALAVFPAPPVKVRFTDNPQAVLGCRYIQPIPATEDTPVSYLRAKALSMGANVVFENRFDSTSGSASVRGSMKTPVREAYRCPAPATAK